MRNVFLISAALVLCSCTGTGQPEVSFPAYFMPSNAFSFVVDDVTIDLDEALVAFGPAYFCASASGSATLCETALGEIRSETVLDVLQSDPQPVGTYRGFVGDVRSGSYDLGIHWYMAQQEPRSTSTAVDGHSARFHGTATRAGATVGFEMLIDIVPQYRGQRGVPTVSVAGEVTEETRAVELRADIASWLSKVDYDEMFASGEDPYVIQPGMTNHDAIAIRMVSNAPVGFVFVEAAP